MLTFSLRHGESSCVLGIGQCNYYHEISFCHPKKHGLALVIINSTQQKSVIIHFIWEVL